jgi:hypothetical protein
VLRDFLAVSNAVFDMQADGVLDIFDSLFVGAALAVAALQRGAGNEIAIRISFYDDGKCEVFHN